ncbi:MAG: hypothetical protein IKO52_15885 [Clostridia bacterium]|nr:hypothetical protein [Clostridia bacterium]
MDQWIVPDYSAAHPGFTGFLGMIRFDNPWVLIFAAALFFGNIPLNILLRKSLLDEIWTKVIRWGYVIVCLLIIFAMVFIMMENGNPTGVYLIPIV